MRHSLVVRLTALTASILAVSFVAWSWIVLRSTSATFVDVQSEVIAGAPEGAAVTTDATVALRDALRRAWDRGGWEAVRGVAADPATAGLDPDTAFLVVDGEARVAVATRPDWVGAHAEEQADGAVLVRTEADLDGAVAELEIRADGPVALAANTVAAPWGRLVLLPAAREPESGPGFAARVWRTSAVGLIAVVLAAMVATAWVLRRALAPIDRLTRAACELQEGRIPVRLRREGTTEFAGLIDAFNSAAESIDRTERLRKRLISDIAHELRTPVTNVKGQLEALQQGLIRADAEFVETLQAETRLLERLVEDFHQLALSDAGALRMDLQTLPLAETVRGILAPLADAAGARLVVDPPGGLAVRADEERLRQILTNLMENSVRHRPTGLTVEVVARADGSFVAFEFRDDGPGIAPEDRPHVFERFYRAERSRNRASGGAGLGLSIVQGLVLAMGGSIRHVASEADGAAFEIRLPRAECH